MSDKGTFAANLKRLIDASPWSERQIAERAGISPRTLSRWLHGGIRRPDGRTLAPLRKVCRLLKVHPDDLWQHGPSERGAQYANRVRELFAYWERLGVPCDEMADCIDRRYHAVRVARRFRREELELAEVVRRIKDLATEGDLQAYLEAMIREWKLDEDAAYRRLIENTQRFLAAALPADAEPLAEWFQQTHPGRWKHLVQERRIDSDAELVAYIRHMLDDGLSRHEIYEALIRLSRA